MAESGNDGSVVTSFVPLTGAQRVRRSKDRKRAAAAGRDPAGRFSRGNQVAVKSGAFSPAVTGPLAQRFAEEFTRSAVFPADGRDDALLMDAVLAWAYARAQAELLRQRRDLLDNELGAQAAVDAALTEVTQGSETEVRPPGSTMTRDSVIEQRESLGRAVHRAEMALRTFRMDLAKLLAARTGRKAKSLAIQLSEIDDDDEQAV